MKSDRLFLKFSNEHILVNSEINVSNMTKVFLELRQASTGNAD